MEKENKTNERYLGYPELFKENSLSDEIEGDNKKGLYGYIYVPKVKEFIRIILKEDLKMCKVCGSSHGDWIDKRELIKRIKKRAGEKLW